MDAAPEHPRRAPRPRTGDAALEGEPLSWRGLGRREDLDIDLRPGARAGVAAELLAACLTGVGGQPANRERTVLGLTLAGRIGALCAVLSLTEPASALEIVLRCPRAGCEEAFALELTLAELQERAAEAERRPTVEIALAGRAPLRVRRPTGADQRDWRRGRFDTLAQAEHAMVQSLLEGGAPAPDPLPSELVAAISAAMEEIDPLPSFQVQCRCVACDAQDEHAIDLELALLRRLRRSQRSIMSDVDGLARGYGWTEADALALPTWRRRAYLDMIEARA